MKANPIVWPLHWQILLALILSVGAAASLIGFGWEETPGGTGLIAVCTFLGRLFLNALSMLVVPLVVSCIISGVMSLGSDNHVGRLGAKTLIYYTLTGLVAVLIGLMLVNTIKPGAVSVEAAERLISQAESPEVVRERVADRGAGDIVDIFLRMIPTNVFAAGQDNSQLLSVIVFSLLFGFFISRLPEKQRLFQENLWNSLSGIMMKLAGFIIRFAPIGVFALVTPQILATGYQLIYVLLAFFMTTLLALALHFTVTMSALLYFVGRVNPLDHYKAMAAALLTAFSSASSVSTLPVTLDCVENKAGVSNRVSSFTLPLGATVNMDGTALYECVVVIFIAQLYAVVDPSFTLTFGTQFTVVILALLTSIGVAGIPAASLVAIAVILGVVGLPLEYIGIVMVVDRVLDMCRTAVNVFSDSVGAVVIARTEGESNFYQPRD